MEKGITTTRRNFLKTCLVAPALYQCGGAGPLARIGLTTVTFRTRFAQTRVQGVTSPHADLKLVEIPGFFRDRFHLKNVEFWSEHFENTSPGYLSDLKRSLERAGSTLVDIQVDGPYNLSDDDESARTESVAYVKNWLDIASTLGAKNMRANTGMSGSYDSCMKSIRELVEYATGKGVILLHENHGGVVDDPHTHVRIIQEINSPFYRTLPDYGNYQPDVRYDGLKTIMPFAGLVSAKVESFDDNWQHTRFDFGRCMRIAEDSGFTGVYSGEYWAQGAFLDEELVADRVIAMIQEYV